jgi:hypothetical protein
LDREFGTSGRTILSDPAGFVKITSLALDSENGKLLAAGQIYNINPPRPVVFRLNADGSLDSTFGANGMVDWIEQPPQGGESSAAYSIVTTAGGSFYLAGATVGAFLARFSSSGALDPSFATGGIAKTSSAATGGL